MFLLLLLQLTTIGVLLSARAALGMPLADQTTGEDPSLLSPSQNVEVRFHHPQLLVRSGPLEGTLLDPEDQTTEHEMYGRRTDTSVFSAAPNSGRFRSKDSSGAGLRRAVTGTPALQTLPTSDDESIFTPIRSKNGGITARKIVGFGPSLPSGRSSGSLQGAAAASAGGRKESFSHNKLIAGGETPASTHTDPSSPQWLFGATHKEGRRPVDPFRMPVVAHTRPTTTTTARTTSRTTKTTTSTTPSTTTTEEITTTTTSTPTTTQETTTVEPITSTQRTTTSALTPELNYATPETNYGVPEINYGTPERNYATPEVNYGTTVSTTELPTSSSTTTTTESASTDPALVTIQLISTLHPIKEFDSPSLDGQQGLDHSVKDDEDEDQDEPLLQQQPAAPLPEMEAEKYLVEEKTPDGHIVGEFGVISRSSGSLIHGVRYVAHGSIDPDLIKEALRTFLSLK